MSEMAKWQAREIMEIAESVYACVSEHVYPIAVRTHTRDFSNPREIERITKVVALKRHGDRDERKRSGFGKRNSFRRRPAPRQRARVC